MKIAVIGTGTAGILSLSHCLAYFPSNWQIYSIHDPRKPILGIGESTSTQIPASLFRSINFSLLDHADELDATIKLGVKFCKWRKVDFYSHILPIYYAMHFDNSKLKSFAFDRFKKLYNNFFEIEGKVESLNSTDDKAYLKVNDKSYEFDYVIDCGGYPEDYSDYTFSDCISVNSCLVHNIKEPAHWNYTYHTATPNGWMFGIPLRSRQGWGYLYNDSITSKEDAIKDLKENYFADFDSNNIKEFNFKSYRANTIFDGRILKNGNRALFYEPIEAVSGYFYEQVLRYFCDYLTGEYHFPQTNHLMLQKANDIEIGISYIYQGGSVYDTPFWKNARNISRNKLRKDRMWRDQISLITQMKKTNDRNLMSNGIGVFNLKSWLDFEYHMEYNTFCSSR